MPETVGAADLFTTTALYKYFDAEDVLLYVGISDALSKRTATHLRGAIWMQFVSRSTVERYPTRDDALTAETAAIKAEHPIFNQQHNDTPEAKERRRLYLEQYGGEEVVRAAHKQRQTPARPQSRPSATTDDDWDIEPDDPAPECWPRDYWCREWWNAPRASNAAQYSYLEAFGCPKRAATEAIGMWYQERRYGAQGDGRGWPVVWYQEDHAPPAEATPYRPFVYSIHADVTCVEPCSEFTAEVARVQKDFLHALHAAGYCRSVHPGPAAAAFGFTHDLEAQIAGTILGELARGGTDIALGATASLHRELERKAA